MAAKVCDIFDELPPHVQSAFMKHAKVISYSPRGIIYCEGDSGTSMFRVFSGEVKLSVSRGDGRELYYVFLGPGDCFGESNWVDGLLRPQTAQATTDLKLQVLPGCGIEALMNAHPEFNLAMMRLLANHMRLLIDLCADAGLNDLAGRVARRIVSALPSDGRTQQCGRLPVNLSQSDLAHMVGASRQSVNKVLQRFQEERLITTEYGGVIVEKPELLCQRAFPEGLSAN